MKFLTIIGTYKCPDCGKEIEINEEFEKQYGNTDSGLELECVCGLAMSINISFNDDLIEVEDEE